jgi:rhamnopyranosyl-N-acetylglucosaminyl-diphospho-decaprenol beta-1,3/1,4-galactofuranosyltransferase
MGADWVWCGDDDGRPGDEHVLQTLLTEAHSRGLAAVSPMVVNIDDPLRLAFPLRRGLTWKRNRDELGTDFLPGIASLFNGALFAASTLDVVGVPDYRLFVRGDEVEVHRRLVRSGLPFGTSLRCTYVHPDGSAEFKPMLGGRFHAQDPADEV